MMFPLYRGKGKPLGVRGKSDLTQDYPGFPNLKTSPSRGKSVFRSQSCKSSIAVSN